MGQLGRITAEATGEAMQTVGIACAIAGVLAIGTTWEKTAATKPKWAFVVAAIVLAWIARFALLRNALPYQVQITFLAPLTVAVVAVIVARTTELRVVIVALAGLALVDIAVQLAEAHSGLDALGGESIDPGQRARILTVTLAGEHRHLLVAVIDLALLVGLVARPKREPIRAVMLAPAVVVLLALTPFEWLGLRRAIADLDVSIATRGAGGSGALGATIRDESLTGPTLAIRDGKLEASPNAETPFATYDAKLAEVMARTTSDQPPLLLSAASDRLGSVLEALGPLVSSHQVDYQLVVSQPPAAGTGPYAPIIDASRLYPITVDLVAPKDAKEAIALPPETTMAAVEQTAREAGYHAKPGEHVRITTTR
jgi:hypothetical protein